MYFFQKNIIFAVAWKIAENCKNLNNNLKTKHNAEER